MPHAHRTRRWTNTTSATRPIPSQIPMLMVRPDHSGSRTTTTVVAISVLQITHTITRLAPTRARRTRRASGSTSRLNCRATSASSSSRGNPRSAAVDTTP